MSDSNEIIIYQPDEQSTMLEVRVEDETVWLTQAQMSELFLTTRNNITLHIGNIFRENELNELSVCKDSLLTAKDGKKYKTKFYNLDAIIAVGYRVNSKRATQFRIAEKEYDRYKPIQDRLFESDFDKMINKQMRNPLIT